MAVLSGLGWLTYQRLSGGEEQKKKGKGAVAPVEVDSVVHGPIELRRTFSGTLEARAQFVVAPKIAGRIKTIHVDIGDTVKRDQVVADLDDDELTQAVTRAEADLAVAEARVTEAESALTVKERELERVKQLAADGIESESSLETAEAELLSRKAALEVAKAQVRRAEAELSAAKIRKGYTRVIASWTGKREETRVVAERFVDEGSTISANSRLLSIVSLDPIIAVVYTTERDYALLKADQVATLRTDAYPDRTFQGRIVRIAPVFRQASRQARVELIIDNPKGELKPGLFVRAEVTLNRIDDAIHVPVEALVKRGGETGVFLVDESGTKVSWRVVKVGIRQGGRVQVIGKEIDGRVVTLGHQLIEDESAVTIP